jgi:hypothetical protein
MKVSHMKHMIVPMYRPETGPLLAGRLDGRRAFARALEGLPSASRALLVILDFRGIDFASSSFLSEAVVHFRDHLRLSRNPSYLVAANLADNPLEELDYLLTESDDALIVCALSTDGEISEPKLIGSLDQKLKETFDLVLCKGETSAVELHSESNQADQIGPTAWNNRLNLLSGKSLLFEIPQGRTKKFRPLLEVS